MKKTEDLLKAVVLDGYSFGSGAFSVVNSKVKMEINEYGEYKPDLTQLTNEEEFAELLKVSPNVNTSTNEDHIGEKLFSGIQGIKYDVRVGYYKSLYAGYVVEGDYRKNASSGGFGTWIFKELFERELIDGVIHVKENDDKSSPILFKYDISRSIEEIQAGAKTRYYPVEFSQVINKIKDCPGRYAIIGIPSFIYSIRLLAENDPTIKERIKYTIGLICGHQKSARFADCLAWQVGIKPGNLKSINFRKKLSGYPADQYGVELTGIIDGKETTIIKKMSELIGNDWGQGYFKSKASDFTDDVMNETADVTLGDAWLPEYTRDSGGNNVILVRSSLIDKIIQDGIKHSKIKVDEIDLETAVKSQLAHFQHTRNELGYRLYKLKRNNKWTPLKRIKENSDIPYFRKRIQDIRMEISEQSHLHFKKAVELNDLDYFIKRMKKYSKKYYRIYFYKRLFELTPKKVIKRIIVGLSRFKKI